MDYAAIYASFISSRRELEPALRDYSERHHILPKKLGGTNKPSNLIRLTPEDHFFAHLLLAKIHGGSMWAPVALMAGKIEKRSRKAYGWARRALSKSLSGDSAYQFDYKIRSLIHMDGRAWSGLQSEMPQLGMSKSLANMVVKGRIKSAKGWYLAENDRPVVSGPNHPRCRKESHDFVHVDGRAFTGTQSEFKAAHGVASPAVSLLARGKVKVWNGWHIKGTELPEVGRASRWAKLAQPGT